MQKSIKFPITDMLVSRLNGSKLATSETFDSGSGYKRIFNLAPNLRNQSRF